MKLIKKIINFLLTYIIRPVIYRSFVLRWETFKRPPYFFIYYGYKVYYRQKDGLVYHVGSMGSFESDVINFCVKNIPENATVVDVGANIGLITLPLARKINGTTFHCFEPSPYPHQYFKMTIVENKLIDRIRLNKMGLYDKTGHLNFYIHQLKDASGDGIKDTGRAGKAKKISINVITLDKYVKDNKIKKVDFIKADVEGSETHVFKGGIKTIRKYKPQIVFEAWPKNLDAYNLSVDNVYDFFKSINYSIYTLNMKKLNRSEFLKETQIQGNYTALHV